MLVVLLDPRRNDCAIASRRCSNWSASARATVNERAVG